MKYKDTYLRAGLEPRKVPPEDWEEYGDFWHLHKDLRNYDCYRDISECCRVSQCH